MFSDGYGFVVDYLAEILRTFRNHDFSQQYTEYFELLSDISTRDRDGINKTFSGPYEGAVSPWRGHGTKTYNQRRC